MSLSPNILARQVYEQLRQDILAKRYHYNERLPSGVELARQLNASYVTVTKAIKQLCADGYVESRRGVGNFVRYVDSVRQPSNKKLNLICQLGAHELYDLYLKKGREFFEAAGWEVRVLRVKETLRECWEEFNSPEYFSLVYAALLKPSQFKATQEQLKRRVIIFGQNVDNDITCITCDESQVAHLCLEHFRKQGLTRTGFFISTPSSEVETQCRAAWESQMMAAGHSFEWCNNHAFSLNYNQVGQNMMDDIDRLIDENLDNGRFQELDSIIIRWDEVSVRLASKCHDRGIRIPQDLAIINAHPVTEQFKFFRPQIAYIDNDFVGHLKIAVQLMEAKWRGTHLTGSLFFCQPKLVVHESALPNPE